MKFEIETGAWIVAAYKVISKYSTDHPALDPLEAIVTAGRAGELFSATRSLGKIDADRFEKHRKLVRLRVPDAKRVLKAAEVKGLVSISWAPTPKPS